MTETGDINSADVPSAIGHEPTLGIEAPKFIPCAKYSSFEVEVAALDGDFVFHFYMPKSGVKDYRTYWEDTFPTVLDQVARDYFKVAYPRLKATHVKELGIDSWWMRAYGFASQSLNPDAFVDLFYTKLHEALVSLNRT